MESQIIRLKCQLLIVPLLFALNSFAQAGGVSDGGGYGTLLKSESSLDGDYTIRLYDFEEWGVDKWEGVSWIAYEPPSIKALTEGQWKKQIGNFGALKFHNFLSYSNEHANCAKQIVRVLDTNDLKVWKQVKIFMEKLGYEFEHSEFQYETQLQEKCASFGLPTSQIFVKAEGGSFGPENPKNPGTAHMLAFLLTNKISEISLVSPELADRLLTELRSLRWIGVRSLLVGAADIGKKVFVREIPLARRSGNQVRLLKQVIESDDNNFVTIVDLGLDFTVGGMGTDLALGLIMHELVYSLFEKVHGNQVDSSAVREANALLFKRAGGVRENISQAATLILRSQ